jgi:hypothetical protein
MEIKVSLGFGKQIIFVDKRDNFDLYVLEDRELTKSHLGTIKKSELKRIAKTV